MSSDEALVPLPWETRNLGLPAFRLGDAWIETADRAALRSRLAATARERGSFFAQARVRCDSRLSQKLAQSGFYFVEATYCPHTSLARNDPLGRFSADPAPFLPGRFEPAEIRIAGLARSDAGLCAAVRQIARESFSDDRFHRDHNCEPRIADRRFEYWVDDLFGDTSVAFDIMLLRESPVAFLARRADDMVLCGFARQYTRAGLGDFIVLHAMRAMQAAGLKQAQSLISLNNIPVMNLLERLGFKMRDPRATFHYWSRLGIPG